jgi:hypothetical protein
MYALKRFALHVDFRNFQNKMQLLQTQTMQFHFGTDQTEEKIPSQQSRNHQSNLQQSRLYIYNCEKLVYSPKDHYLLSIFSSITEPLLLHVL